MSDKPLEYADLERIHEALRKAKDHIRTDRCPVCHQPVYVLYPDNPAGICFDCAGEEQAK